MKKNYRNIILTVAIFAVAAFMIIWNYMGSTKVYNNGTCAECGGHFHLVGNPTQYDKHYIYECDGCGEVIRSMVFLK